MYSSFIILLIILIKKKKIVLNFNLICFIHLQYYIYIIVSVIFEISVIISDNLFILMSINNIIICEFINVYMFYV